MEDILDRAQKMLIDVDTEDMLIQKTYVEFMILGLLLSA